MENKKIGANKVIGYWMSEKKRQKLNWSGFRNVCKEHGFDLVKLDLNKPLDDQGSFNIILHKLIEIIIQANRGDEKASTIMNEIERYIKEHPEVAIIDPLDNVRQLLDRYKSYSVIHGSTDLLDSEVFTPSFVEITSTDVEENIRALKRAGVKFPFVCKPSLSHGSSEAHQMAVIFNEKGVRDCKPVSVAQTFINHNAILYKVYCVGEEYFVVERPSLKNFYSNDRDTIFFCTNDVSKADSTSSLTVLDADDPSPKSPPLDRKRLDKIVKVLRKEIGLALLGIDIVIENGTNRYAVIDINSYPGYDGYPNFFDSLMNCIIQTIDSHERKLTMEKQISPGRGDILEKGKENGLPSPTTKLGGKYAQMNSNCQANDQDDSGFDTSDSSDEKKKQLTAKVRNR